jgi:LDH2 family malate/lactate/ureidoglycolate dehydrogenase
MTIKLAPMQAYAAADLERWTAAVFTAAGVRADDAAQTARVLVRTNLRGIDTHGVVRVLSYVEMVRDGKLNPAPAPTVTMQGGVLVFDADRGLGQAAGSAAVTAAIDAMGQAATITCLLRNTGHLAALGQFVLDAAERGLIAFMCQETPPLMSLPGSLGKAIGNNPLAFAAPVAGCTPLVFDMAVSVVARGNVLQAVRDGDAELPQGWAIGPDGEPTTDPRQALQGAMLPVAGHKGIGLAMMVQVLAGSLSASTGALAKGPLGATSSGSDTCSFLMLIDPDRIIGRATFDAHMAGWIETYRAASGATGRYPGERAAEEETRRLKDGIPLPPSVVAELTKAGGLVRLAFDLQPMG